MGELHVDSTSNVPKVGSQEQASEESYTKINLRSLAPEFKVDHHDVYVRHLEEAVQEKRNRNIALTGRYGAGKSSILDNFEEKHKAKTVRISINTLGPDEEDEDLTNRIQKELVKQLVYRLKPGEVRRSRFARPKPITKWTALLQSLGVSGVGLGFLWLLGVHPPQDWPGAQANGPIQLGLGMLFFALVVLAVWSVRWLIGDRIVSEVTTAGTKIALGDGPTTYFDSFLDEIVAFFDTVEPEFVIFEDLDRFDDPQIFDSLRELNTLVNASAHWKSKEQPLRFIYAIKDSLFEQLGADAALKEDTRTAGDPPATGADEPTPTAVKPKPDLATEAVHRANRTKFFEMVIPIVPFLSHRNARDHLSDALTALGFPKDFVSRPLLDLVARHTTDMRLMINICNEFAVFVERLLRTENAAPGMTADHLFALVVYKNFHLHDFEKIAQRTSTLDRLEKHHRDDVRSLIDGLQTKRRTRYRLEEHRRRRVETAAALGLRLQDMKRMFPEQYAFKVTAGNKSFNFDAVDSVAFWELVSSQGAFTVSQERTGRSTQVDAVLLERLFPELTSPGHWCEPSPEEFSRVTSQCDDEIARLRGADFVGLAQYERVPEGNTPFAQRITDELKSELARDLVRKGFITRNYAEYSAIFYGSFTGVDVAYFYNHSVQPNEMYLDFHFTSANAVSNLLEQVPSDFTSTASTLNVEVVDFVLTGRPQAAREVVAYIVSHASSEDVQSFLDAFFNTPAVEHEALVGLLAAHPWQTVFEYLAAHHSIPDVETRLRLVDAALLRAQAVESYEFGDAASEFFETYHPQMKAITVEHTPDQVARVFDILEATKFVAPDLAPLSEPLRERVMAAHMYDISAHNLQLALGIKVTPTLDLVRKNNEAWPYCRSRISDYLKAMQADKGVECLLQSERVLIEVINECEHYWADDQLGAVIEGSADSVAIVDLQEVPERVWPMLFQSHHVLPSIANVVAYTNAHGVDEQLASFLSPDGAEPIKLQIIDDVDDDARAGLAISLLNASEHLSPEDRVALAIQVTPADGFDLVSIKPSRDQLLARGLEADLFEDDLGTFTHFAPGGWDAMSDAFEVSRNVAGFMSPAIVPGFVTKFLGNPRISKRLKKIVLDDLSRYVPNDDAPALGAAGEFARTESIKLPLDEVRRIARVAKTAGAIMRQLVLSRNELTLDEVVEILSCLGAPYDRLSEGPGARFEHPGKVPSLDTVFKHLEESGRIRIRKNRLGSGKTVEVLV